MLRVASLSWLALALVVAGCPDDDNDVPDAVVPDVVDDVPTDVPNDVPPDPETADLRVIHLSPDAPAVDIYANDEEPALFTDLEFQEGTEYQTVPAGTYDVAIAPAGTSPDDAVLTVEDVELEENSSNTAVAFDELDDLQALALEDDLEDVPDDQFRVRAIHVAVGVEEVDIWDVTDPGDPQPLYTDVDFGDATDYAELDAGTYSLGFDLDGDADPDVVFELPEIEEDEVVNLYAVADGEDVFLIAQLRDGSTVRIDPVAAA